jgi:hypothetical protein
MEGFQKFDKFVSSVQREAAQKGLWQAGATPRNVSVRRA